MSISRFCREPDHIYAIEGDSGHLYWTGLTAEGEQLFVTILPPRLLVVFFDDEGNFLRAEERDLSAWTLAEAARWGIGEVVRTEGDPELSSFLDSVGFRESVIRVKRFFLPSYHVGIVDFPKFFQEILVNPSAHDEDERRVAPQEFERWFREGVFELWLDDRTNVWLSASGIIESS